MQDDDWEDVDRVHIPEELLTFDIDQVNASCAARQEQFLMAPCCARPFERLQFIRGTVNLYMDLMDMPDKMKDFLEKFHDFHCRLMTKWAQTDVDALMFMDDWGSQRDLLINPTIWEAVFQPMYRDFIVAKAKEAGLVLTNAGSAFPYGKDPKDTNIRIAPSYPTLEDLKQAMEIFTLSIKLVSIEKLLENK